MQTLKKGTIDSHYLPNYPCIVDSESHSNPFYMYTYYVYIIYIYVLHIFDDANCIPIMIPIVDGESNFWFLPIVNWSNPQFYVVKKNKKNTITNYL